MQSSENCFKQLLILIFHVKTNNVVKTTAVGLRFDSIQACSEINVFDGKSDKTFSKVNAKLITK